MLCGRKRLPWRCVIRGVGHSLPGTMVGEGGWPGFRPEKGLDLRLLEQVIQVNQRIGVDDSVAWCRRIRERSSNRVSDCNVVVGEILVASGLD